MEILYLKDFEKNPKVHPSSPSKNRGIELPEIHQLEQLYNAGKPFPKVLREYLLLAGNYSWVYSMNIYITQQTFQDGVRKYLQQYSQPMTRPFFVLEFIDEIYSFVFLDEVLTIDDPTIYDGDVTKGESTVESTEQTLSENIQHRMKWIRISYNIRTGH